MNRLLIHRRLGFLLMSVAFIAVPTRTVRGDETRLKQSVQLVIARNMAAAKSQNRIDKLSDETDQLFNRYREIQRQTESLRIYNAQVEKLVSAQQAQIDNLNQQISKAAQIGREITPLMLRMIDSLEAFIRLDIPFLPEERRQRIEYLHQLIDRSDVPESEKFRRLLEAYQIENEFGRTIEAYKGKLQQGDETRTVDFLRVGRLVLVYRTLDDKEMGVWDSEKSQWQIVPKDYHNSIRTAFRIARKQTAPDLIRLPVPVAKEVQ